MRIIELYFVFCNCPFFTTPITTDFFDAGVAFDTERSAHWSGFYENAYPGWFEVNPQATQVCIFRMEPDWVDHARIVLMLAFSKQPALFLGVKATRHFSVCIFTFWISLRARRLIYQGTYRVAVVRQVPKRPAITVSPRLSLSFFHCCPLWTS